MLVVDAACEEDRLGRCLGCGGPAVPLFATVKVDDDLALEQLGNGTELGSPAPSIVQAHGFEVGIERHRALALVELWMLAHVLDHLSAQLHVERLGRVDLQSDRTKQARTVMTHAYATQAGGVGARRASLACAMFFFYRVLFE